MDTQRVGASAPLVGPVWPWGCYLDLTWTGSAAAWAAEAVREAADELLNRR